MQVLRNGKFSMPITKDKLSKGLRKTSTNAVNQHSMITCSGMIGKQGILQRIKALTKSLAITDTFPYPQIFVETNLVIVCTGTSIYEFTSNNLFLKITTTEASTWSLVSFHDFVYLSNGAIAVVRDPDSKVWSISTDVPTAMTICNYNGQVIIGAPDAGYEL